MPNWNEILNEIKAAGSTHDVVRRKYLKRLYEHTGRNVIIYYSGWLQKGVLQTQGYTAFARSSAMRPSIRADHEAGGLPSLLICLLSF